MSRRGMTATVWTTAAALGAAGCTPGGGFKITPVPVDRTLEPTVVIRESPWISERIAIVDLDGILENREQGNFFSDGENPVSLTLEKLDAARVDKNVRAVLLRINSPGGTVTASDVLYQEVRRFRAETGKPVIAVMMDVAASGGYYVACAADQIIAHETTITGSIGVLMQMVSLAGTLQKVGIKTDAIASGSMKDAGSPLRDMTPEERKVFETVVNGFYNRFIEVVLAGRPNLDREKLLKIADGRIYTAKQALELGLIDRIGTLREAVAVAKERAGLTRANTVIYRRPLGWKPNVYAHAPGGHEGGLVVNLLNITGGKSWTNTPRFVYLWTLE